MASLRACPRIAPSLLAATLAASFACSGDDTFTNPNIPPGLQLFIAPTTATILVSDTVTSASRMTLAVAATSLSRPVPTPPGVVFTTSDASIATVDSTGVVTPTGFGTTVIRASVGGANATSTIVVDHAVQSITLSPTTLNGVVGDTILVSASGVGTDGALVPGTAYNFSADPSAATITKTGTRTTRVILQRAGAVSLSVTAGGRTTALAGTAQVRDFISSAVAGAAAGSLTIAAGNDATCGLLPLGRAYCFGQGNLIGFSRDSTCFNDVQPLGPLACTLIPLRIAGQLNMVSVSVGGSVACGITSDSHAYCWGSQDFGQLGNGIASTGSSTTPNLVIGPVTRTAVSLNRVAAGGDHACGLNAQGNALCWGRDNSFQLGNGDGLAVNSTTPIPVAGGFLFSSITAGGAHSCAIRASDNIAMCWGDNSQGQLGNGIVGGTSDTPVTVSGAPPFVAISAGGLYTCGLTAQSTVYCWGSNQFGQLGRGSVDPSGSGSAIQVAGTYKAVAAGSATTCAITTGGAASCWGRNNYGQLGTGSIGNNANAPVSVGGGRTDFTAITTGARHTCAVGASGAYCWGSNVLGALGNELQAMIQPLPTKTATPQ
jgi:alpha-tubulin suppressor-like RCC1 family protein